MSFFNRFENIANHFSELSVIVKTYKLLKIKGELYLYNLIYTIIMQKPKTFLSTAFK